jgi:phage gp36-like protein
MAYITISDLHGRIHEHELNHIVSNDQTLIEAAIDAATAEVKAFLHDSFDTELIFGATGSGRHNLLVRYVADITLYDLIASVQAGQNTEDRIRRYDRAMRWLKDAATGKIYPDLPRRETTVQSEILFGSLDRLNNTY